MITFSSSYHGNSIVAGRNSDNTFIKQVLNWEPRTSFKEGLTRTYKWIESQYMRRKAGQRIVEEI